MADPAFSRGNKPRADDANSDGPKDDFQVDVTIADPIETAPSGADTEAPATVDEKETPRKSLFDEETPLVYQPKSTLLDQDLSEKSGNYVFTFGFPASGKTTFHSVLVRYLMQVGPFKTEIKDRTTGLEPNYETNRMITEWMREWRSGRFPKGTPVGDEHIRELSFNVLPLQGERTPLDFTLLEVSGEMLKTVMPDGPNDPTLSDILSQILNNPKINLTIILLVHPDVHTNDELFMNFMDYLDRKISGDIRKRASLGIVISNPPKALEVLKTYRPEHKSVTDLRGIHVENFLEIFAPTTYRIWLEWPNPKRKMLSRFYIGEIGEVSGKPRLIRPDYTSASIVFGWLYTQFTGRVLGPTFLQRALRWLRA
jgi:hypothetical protein